MTCAHCGAPVSPGSKHCSKQCADADQAGDDEERRRAFLEWVDAEDDA